MHNSIAYDPFDKSHIGVKCFWQYLTYEIQIDDRPYVSTCNELVTYASIESHLEWVITWNLQGW